MDIYYLSEGEKSARMSLDELENNLYESYEEASRKILLDEIGYPDIEQLILDMTQACDKQGFWIGTIGGYHVAIVACHMIATLRVAS